MDRPFRKWSLAIEVVFEANVIDDQFVVEVDRNILTDHADTETVPLTNGVVGEHEGILFRLTLVIVPKTLTFVRTNLPFSTSFV